MCHTCPFVGCLTYSCPRLGGRSWIRSSGLALLASLSRRSIYLWHRVSCLHRLWPAPGNNNAALSRFYRSLDLRACRPRVALIKHYPSGNVCPACSLHEVTSLEISGGSVDISVRFSLSSLLPLPPELFSLKDSALQATGVTWQDGHHGVWVSPWL